MAVTGTQRTFPQVTQSKFKAAIFDWAGTTVDFGSFAPMGAFVKAFEAFGISVTIDQAREPMGAPKLDHIRAMLDMPEITHQWQAVCGAAPTVADVDRIYEVFVPMNEKVAAEYANLVPDTKEAIDTLRAMGLKIGSTTGYTRSIMAHVLPVAAAQGWRRAMRLTTSSVLTTWRKDGQGPWGSINVWSIWRSTRPGR